MKRQLEFKFDNKENIKINNANNCIEHTDENAESNKYDESTPYAFCAVILIIVSILF